MIFRRRKSAEPAAAPPADAEGVEPVEGVDPDEIDQDDAVDEDEDVTSATGAVDFEALDALEWRDRGPWDVSEVDLEVEPIDGSPRIDLGSMIVTGFANAELRLQVAEQTQQIVSAMLISGDSALELGAYAAPRSGGLWPELREELTEAATEAGGSVSLVEGPFGVELRRLLPVQTPDGQQGYQPSRMWVVEGPRWMLRGIVYGQAALADGEDAPVAPLLQAFRNVIVRRDDQAMAPGDLLTLVLPQGVQPAEEP